MKSRPASTEFVTQQIHVMHGISDKDFHQNCLCTYMVLHAHMSSDTLGGRV